MTILYIPVVKRRESVISHTLCLVVVLATLLLASGCMPHAVEPEPLERVLAYTPSVQAQYARDEQWWQTYNDSQLNRLVETAFSRNIDLAKAAVTVNKALYTARRVGADLLPEFSSSGEGTARRELNKGDSAAKTLAASVGVSYEVDLWQKLADTASAKEWEYRATEEDKDAVRLTLAASATDFYFELAYLHSATAASQASVDMYKQINQIVSRRHQSGKVSALEPEQAAQAVLTEENRLHSLEIRKREVEKSLRLLLNHSPNESLELSFDDEFTHTAETVNLGVPLAVLANRPDLKAAEFRLRGAFKDVNAAQKAWYPTITLSAALGASSDSFSPAFDVPFTSGAIVINLPFLQWNKVKWDVKISEAEYDLLKLEFEKKLNTAVNEVAMANAYYANAIATFTNAEDRYARSAKICDIYMKQYEHGKRELSDWLEAMNTMWAAKIEMLEYRYQILRRNNETYKAMAGRYQSRR